MKETIEQLVREFERKFYTLDETVSPPRVICHGAPEQMSEYLKREIEKL